MASRRSLKKDINYTSEITLGLCIMAFIKKKDEKEKIEQLILQVTDLRLEMLKRINHTEPGSVKLFYKKLREEFANNVEAICNQLIEMCNE